MKKSLSFWSALTLLAMAAACAKSSSPTQPTDNSSSAAANGAVSSTQSATITTPRAVSPSDGAQIKWASQPITLTVNNAVTTGRGTLTYSFEVATDTGFSNKAYSRDGVAAGDGQTSVAIDKLKGATTYYWRSHVMLNGTPGPNSKARSFNVGPEVVLQAPILSSPGANATTNDTPTLTVNNVQRSGPAGTIVYQFDLSKASDFSSIDYSGTATEQPGTTATSLTVPVRLDTDTYWWRVQATDTTNGVTSPMSNANPFKVMKFSMANAIIVGTPWSYADWPETAQITYLNMAPDGIRVDFTKKDGPDRWPDITPNNFKDTIQYTMGMCYDIDSKWYCAAPIEMWYGRPYAGGEPENYTMNWFYDPARWAPMTWHYPTVGETIGFYVVAGDSRAGNSSFKYAERSNVVLVPFPGNAGASWTFSQSRLPLGSR